MLMAATVLVGRPVVFSDTDDYYAQGRSVVRVLEQWARQGKPPVDVSDLGYRLSNPDGADEEPEHNQDGARSVYYGLLLYLAQAVGSLWLLAGIQAVTAAVLVRLIWRRVAPEGREGGYLAVMAALCLGSSLAVFTGFAMPDVFAGFAAIATVLAVAYADTFGPWAKAALWALLAAAINFHGSNLMTAACVGGLGLAGMALLGTGWRRLLARSGFILSAMLAAMLAAKAYGMAVRLRTGDELGRPPFLTARVLADGPGRAYLAHACGDRPKFQVCAFKGLPLTDTEDILWADEPELGIFNSQEYPVRLREDHEDLRFALAAVAYQPGRELAAALRNWGAQLASTDLGESLRDPGYYLVDPYWKTTNLPRLIQGTGRCDPEHGTCALRAPRGGLQQLFALTAMLALAVSAGALGLYVRRWRRGGGRLLSAPGIKGVWAASLLILAVPINDAVCGMLSGPFARYQMRMLWLIPLAAMLLVAVVRKAEERRP